MYPPPYYTDHDPVFMAGLMREHSFAVLSSVVDGQIMATHLPFVLKDEGAHGTLYSHIAKTNPQAPSLFDGPVQIIFSGAHGYVSPVHYDAPNRSVPTWNYEAVHVRGTPRPIAGDAATAEMQILIAQYDQDWDSEAARPYAQAIMGGITVFKLPITQISGFRKMSGNKKPSERKRIITALTQKGDINFAAAMTASLHNTVSTPIKTIP